MLSPAPPLLSRGLLFPPLWDRRRAPEAAARAQQAARAKNEAADGGRGRVDPRCGAADGERDKWKGDEDSREVDEVGIPANVPDEKEQERRAQQGASGFRGEEGEGAGAGVGALCAAAMRLGRAEHRRRATRCYVVDVVASSRVRRLCVWGGGRVSRARAPVVLQQNRRRRARRRAKAGRSPPRQPAPFFSRARAPAPPTAHTRRLNHTHTCEHLTQLKSIFSRLPNAQPPRRHWLFFRARNSLKLLSTPHNGDQPHATKMLASRCVPASSMQFHSRAGARLVAACAVLGTAQAAVAIGFAPTVERVVAAGGDGAGGRKGGRALRKAELPTKTCATCGLPFAYRAKWSKVWDEVKYCSERCRRNRGSKGAAEST